METSEVPTTRPKRRIRPFDILAVIIFAVVCTVLIATLTHQLAIRSEAAAARRVTGRVIGDIAAANGADARSLGDDSFKHDHSVMELNAVFEATRQHTHGKAVVVKQTLTNDASGQAAAIIYRYDGKPTFYIRVTVSHPKNSDSWQLIGISGNASKTPLLKND